MVRAQQDGACSMHSVSNEIDRRIVIAASLLEIVAVPGHPARADQPAADATKSSHFVIHQEIEFKAMRTRIYNIFSRLEIVRRNDWLGSRHWKGGGR